MKPNYELHYCTYIPRNYLTKEVQTSAKSVEVYETSPFSQNLFIEIRFLNGSAASLANISVSKDFTGYRNY